MNDIFKAARLDFYLLKTYMKSTIVLTMLLPAFLAAFNRSIITGIYFAMYMVTASAVYPFSVSEKNGMERLYGILPISKKHLVLGRYLFTCLWGLTVLLFSVIVQPIILNFIGEKIETSDIIYAVVFSVIMFTAVTAFQFPGFYKHGSIKGRNFGLIPLAIYLALFWIIGRLDYDATIEAFIDANPVIAIITVIVISIPAFRLSIRHSIRALKNKEV